MAVITLKLPEQDKNFLQAMAKFEGMSMSELIRSKTFSTLEDEYDARVADMALAEYEEYLSGGGKVMTWDDMVDELEFD